MKIQCDRCAAKYALADDKVAGRRIKIRCKRCAHVLVVDAASASPSDALPEEPWHVLVSGEQCGPMSAEAVSAMLARGEVDERALVWRDGLPEWTPLGSVSELAGDAAPFPGEQPPVATGARNESSVLFSLSNLMPSSGVPTRPATTAAHGDGSGLIDIRALAASTRRATRDAEALVSSSPLIGSPLAPLLAPPPHRRSPRGLLVAAVAAALAATLGASAVVALALSRQPGTPAAPLPVAAPEASASSPQPTPPSVVAPSVTPAETAAHAALPSEEAPASDRRDRRPGVARQVRSHEPDRPAERTPELPAPTTGRESIEELMRRTLDPPTREREPRPERPSEGLGPTPTRAHVASALRAVAASVRECGAGQGSVTVAIDFRGTTGGVANARVSSNDLPPVVRSCVARAVRAARVPPFARDRFTVSYPFRL